MELIEPDDWHCHLRDGAALYRTVPDEAMRFHRVIAMPNLPTPITNLKMAACYRERILRHLPISLNLEPLMVLYLTQETTSSIIQEAASSNIVFACKLYPAGVTTHSQAGIHSLNELYSVFSTMEKVDLPLLIHAESNETHIDPFDRETRFIEKDLSMLIKHFPELRVVIEHISTQYAVDFVMEAPDNVAATITAHHLLYYRHALFEKGLNPHYYCLPILKKLTDQQALRRAATSGHKKFFLGTDSAPHAQSSKECASGCAGIYTAHAAIELYAEVFEQEHALDQLEAFASLNGPRFYRLPINQTRICLEKKAWKVPKSLPFGKEQLVPLRSNQWIQWKIKT